MVVLTSLIFTLLCAAVVKVQAQLTGNTGPTTALSNKSKLCNVLDYGGSAGSSDIGPAISKAFTDCVLTNSGSTLYVPAGNYNMQTWVTLSKGKKWALRLDGWITRTSTSGGHMFLIDSADDFEFYSSTSKGGIQGNGYQCRNKGPRFIRMVNSSNWSLHDLILVDSPEFHVIVENGENGEIYNMVIRGANIGGSDGIDVTGTNHWIHDVEVTNRDECVTVKSPSHNILVERIWCNQSGGCAIGSLGTGTDISDVEYKNIYTNGGNQAFMIKSNGGSGTVSNVLFQDFISRGTAYGLYLNQYWSSQSVASGSGVQLTNIKFVNWNGDVVDGVKRAPIGLICADGAPCTGITLTNVNMWSQSGKANYSCRSAYGSGVSCIKSGSGGSYGEVTVSASKPSGYTTPQTMSGDLSDGFSSTAAIPVPDSIPTSFYPGLSAYKSLMSAGGGSDETAAGTATATTSSGTVGQYGQCGGSGYTGSVTCANGYTCTAVNDYYSQCL